MTISERIFNLLNERDMSQKEFSERTGIAQSRDPRVRYSKIFINGLFRIDEYLNK